MPVLPSIGVDETVFLELSVRALAQYVPCKRADGSEKVEESGPYYRIQTDHTKTGALNAVEAKVYLPSVSATNSYYPYVYVGGQPKTGKSLDAALQNDSSGLWIPLIKVDGVGQVNLPAERVGAKTYVYRLVSDQTVTMKMWVAANTTATPPVGTVRFALSGRWKKYEWNTVSKTYADAGTDVGISTRTVEHTGATGWTTAGAEQVLKVMTTVAFPGTGDFKLMSGDYFFTGSQWSDIKIGKANFDGSWSSTPKSLTIDLTYGPGTCGVPSDIVKPVVPLALPNHAVNLYLRKPGAKLTIPQTTFNLIGVVGKMYKGVVTISNTGLAGTYVHYDFTPPGQARVEGRMASGESVSVRFSGLCPTTTGTISRPFKVVYAEGKTYTGVERKVAPTSSAGDLLYNDDKPISVSVSCVTTPPAERTILPIGYVKALGKEGNSFKWEPVVVLDGETANPLNGLSPQRLSLGYRYTTDDNTSALVNEVFVEWKKQVKSVYWYHPTGVSESYGDSRGFCNGYGWYEYMSLFWDYAQNVPVNRDRCISAYVHPDPFK